MNFTLLRWFRYGPNSSALYIEERVFEEFAHEDPVPDEEPKSGTSCLTEEEQKAMALASFERFRDFIEENASVLGSP